MGYESPMTLHRNGTADQAIRGCPSPHQAGVIAASVNKKPRRAFLLWE
jgi:hypothetical protein|tara:strand:- start:791 stop:934 length:144 start_codon:yes stop_codon:yes gene_type:complete